MKNIVKRIFAIRFATCSFWYKQVPTHCLLLFAIKAGDLLDSVKYANPTYRFTQRATRVRPYEVRIKWINTSLKFSKEIIKVVLINISKLRLLFTVSSTWWSIPDWSIILQHLPSAGQWQTMSLLQDHNVRSYDVHKIKYEAVPMKQIQHTALRKKGFMLSLSQQEFW